MPRTLGVVFFIVGLLLLITAVILYYLQTNPDFVGLAAVAGGLLTLAGFIAITFEIEEAPPTRVTKRSSTTGVRTPQNSTEAAVAAEIARVRRQNQ